MKEMFAIAVTVMALSGSVFAAEPGFDTFICHRGESVDAPENTLPAYKMAVDRGFGFECDIYLSKDGRCFTFHDGDLKRTSGGKMNKKCREASWADEVSKLDVGGWGKWKGSKFEGTRPALLEEVLELARDGRWIYVEIKSGPEIVPYVKNIFAKQHKANNRNTLFICFSTKVCAELKRLMPEYKVYWLTSTHRKDKNGNSLVNTADYVIEMAKSCNADGIDALFDPKIITADYIRAVRESGLEYHSWTVDHTVKSMLAFCRGSQTVTTNCAKKQMDEIAKECGKLW